MGDEDSDSGYASAGVFSPWGGGSLSGGVAKPIGCYCQADYHDAAEITRARFAHCWKGSNDSEGIWPQVNNRLTPCGWRDADEH
jgi:hypothetical protein